MEQEPIKRQKKISLLLFIIILLLIASFICIVIYYIKGKNNNSSNEISNSNDNNFAVNLSVGSTNNTVNNLNNVTYSNNITVINANVTNDTFNNSTVENNISSNTTANNTTNTQTFNLNNHSLSFNNTDLNITNSTLLNKPALQIKSSNYDYTMLFGTDNTINFESLKQKNDLKDYLQSSYNISITSAIKIGTIKNMNLILFTISDNGTPSYFIITPINESEIAYAKIYSNTNPANLISDLSDSLTELSTLISNL